jgi:hypothetical protein
MAACRDDDFDVLADGVMRATAAPVGTPWLWTLALLRQCLVGNRGKRHAKHGAKDSSENKLCHGIPPHPKGIAEHPQRGLKNRKLPMSVVANANTDNRRTFTRSPSR